MQYIRSYQFLFDSPKWGMNLLLVAVCYYFIPIVGPLVMLGYQYTIIEALHRDPNRRYPDFDFNNFVDYLTRGVWPFLVQLIAMLVLMPVLIGLGLGTIFILGGVLSSGDGDSAAPVMVFALVGMVFAYIVFMIVFNLILWPMTLRAGLVQEFGAGFKASFVKSFLRTVGKEMILSALFLMISGFCVALIGLAFCFIGIYPAGLIIVLAQTHLTFQLYQLHLQRGGEPIPLTPPQSPGKPPVMADVL